MTTATKSPRTVSVLWTANPYQTEIVAATVRDGRKVDDYRVIHADDSTDVKWCHADDAERSYVVTCSAYDARPIRCTCPARHDRVVCRHKAATAVLAKRGHLHLPTVANIVPPDCEYDFREAVDGVALAIAAAK